MADTQYSTAGPVCPHCEALFTPDENFYYDEAGYKLECFDCGATFKVQPYTETSWTTSTIQGPGQ
jgi:Zn ribbon nucleic-acid-binding protein